MRCSFGASSGWASSVWASSVWCRSVWASAYGSLGVRCVSPSMVPTGWSSVELWSDGATLRSGGSFYVHGALHVSEVVPSSGPVSGGTRVSVLGARFRESATLRCRFEASGATAAARRVGVGQLECASPPSSGAGSRRVEVSVNGQQFSSSGVAFTYRPSAAVSSVWPVRGASEGGTPVTVLGGGFSSSAEGSGALRCRFNATVVVASYVSESALVCNATASWGHASVEVSTNGREYTSSGVRFELVSLVVSGLVPWSGPSLGGTVVTIGGSRLAHAGALTCTFGASSGG